MAGNPIFHEDIAQISALKKAALDLLPVLEQMRNSIVEQAKANLENARAMGVNKESVLALTKSSDDLKTQYSNVNKAISETKKAQDQLSQAEKAAAELEKQRSKEKAKYLSDLAKEEQKRRDLIKTAEMEAKSIDELAKKTAAMITMRKQMTDITGKNADAYNKLTKEIADNQSKLKAYDSQIGNHQRNVGNYVTTVNIASMSLGEMKKALMDLKNVSFAGKSEEEIKALKLQIGQLTDAIGDMKSEMQVMGTEKSAVFVSGLKFIAAGVEGVVGSLSLFGVESGVIKDLEKKMTSLIAVTQALAEIEDVVSSGKLRAIGIRLQSMVIDAKDTVVKWANVTATSAATSAEEARAVVTGKASIVTKAAAAVQWAWNAALAANPIGLVVAGIATLVAAVGGLIAIYRKYNVVGEDTKKLIIDIAAAEKNYNKTVSDAQRSYKDKIEALRYSTDKEKAIHKENADYYTALEALSTAFVLKQQKLRSLETLDPESKNKLLEQSLKLHNLNVVNLTALHNNELKNISKSNIEKEKKDIQSGNSEKLSIQKQAWDDYILEMIAFEKRKKDIESGKFVGPVATFGDMGGANIEKITSKTGTLDIGAKENIPSAVPDQSLELPVISEDTFKEELTKIQEYASAAQDILSSLSDWIKQDAQNQVDAVNVRYDSELAALDRQLASKTISEEKYNKEKVKIEKKRRDEETKIQKEAAEKQRTIQLIQAVINTALGVTGAIAQSGTLGIGAIVLAALIGIAGAIEIATIASQKFAKGGSGLLVDKSKGGVLQGKRHSQGGISLGEVGEAEDGEYFGIINRNSTEKYKNTLPLLFDAINSGKFENMFARRGDINVKVSDKNTEAMLIEMKKQPRSETKAIDMGDYVIYQTGNYSLKVRKQ